MYDRFEDIKVVFVRVEMTMSQVSHDQSTDEDP